MPATLPQAQGVLANKAHGKHLPAILNDSENHVAHAPGNDVKKVDDSPKNATTPVGGSTTAEAREKARAGKRIRPTLRAR
jgi:hypothetical protein